MKLTCLSPEKAKLKRKIYSSYLSIMLIYLVSFSNVSVYASTINSIASGAWNNTNSWVGGIIPGVNDDVIILSGHNINLTDSRSCNSINISTGGILIEGNSGVLTVQTSCTVSGTMTLLSPITINQIITLNGTCNFNNGTSVFGTNSGFSGNGTLSLNGGNATFNTGSTLNVQSLIVTVGNFTDNIGLDLYNVNFNNTANVGVFGGSANTIIHGTFNWLAGTIGGSGTLTILDSLACTTTNQKILQDNKKMIIEHGASLNNSPLTLSNTAVLQINSGAGFYINSSSNAFILNGNSNTLLDIQSGGALIKNGTNNLTIKSLINLAGNIQINNGSLIFDINTTQNITGSIVNNGTLYTNGGGPYNFTNAVTGTGTFKLDNSISNFNNGSSMTNSILIQTGTLNDNTGLTINNLTLNSTNTPCIFAGTGNTIINGTLTWTHGTIQGSGTITILGILTGTGNGSRSVLESKKIVITQTAEITNGDLRLGGTSILQINNGASLTMNTTTSDFLLGITSTALIDIQTGAQLIKNGANTIDLQCNMTMNGNITINSGTLRLWCNGAQSMNGLILNNGTLNVYAGGPYNFVNAISGLGIFKLNNVTANFNTGSSITNDVRIETGIFNDNIGLTVTNVTLVGTGIPCNWGGSAANTFINSLTWTNGNIIGSGNITITSLLSCITLASRQLQNSKKLIIAQNAIFTNTGLTLLGTSILQINSGANLIINANSSDLEIGSDPNAKIDIQSGGVLTKNGANIFNISSFFVLNGNLTINSGTVKLFSSGTQTYKGNTFLYSLLNNLKYQGILDKVKSHQQNNLTNKEYYHVFQLT